MYRKLIITATAPLLLYYVSVCLAYTATPSFYDHIEPTIATVSMMVGEGMTIYTTVENENRISQVYGPSVYLVNAAFLKLANTSPILASKSAGVFLALGSLIVLFFSFYNRFSFKFAYFGVIFCILLYLPFKHESFWNRPDSLIIFACSLCCAALFIKNKYVSVFLLVLSVLLAFDSKLNSIFYFIPLLPLYVDRQGWKITILSIVLSVLVVFIPFLVFPSFPLPNYFVLLEQTTKHDLVLHNYIGSLSFSILFLLPMFLAVYLFSTEVTRKDRSSKLLKDPLIQSFLLLFICVNVTTVFGAKEGAGPRHLFPFAPIIATTIGIVLHRIFAAADIGTELTRRKRLLIHCLGIIWFCTALGLSARPQLKVFDHLLNDTGRHIADEIKGILMEYPEYSVSMGYADNYTYKYTFFRPLLFARTPDYFLDAPALMDMGESYLKIPPATIEKIHSQAYDIFLIPRPGHPFSMTAYYPSRRRFFGELLPVEFKRNYSEIDNGEYFSVWLANKHQNNEPGNNP